MIRIANKSDITQIAEICKQLNDNSFIAQDLEQLFKSDKSAVIVVEENSVITGFASFIGEENNSKSPIPLSKFIIEQFAVHKDFRQNGIGSALISDLKNRASENGCTTIELKLDYDNYDAVDFYTAMGFTPRSYILETKLTKGV